MSYEQIGQISGAIVIVSGLIYCLGIIRGTNHPLLTSWSVWALLGFAVLVTYKSSGAGSNIWPAIFGFTNPLAVVAIVLLKKQKFKRPDRVETTCLTVSLLSLLLWAFVHSKPEQAQLALYLAITADACAAIPTFRFFYKEPQSERPLPWILFGIGYGIGMFAIEEDSYANYILPIYMLVGSLCISLPLVIYRAKRRAPLMEWM